MRDLCCSSCGKTGVGSCSSKNTGVSESKKREVERNERELRDQTQSSEEAKTARESEIADTAIEKKSSEGDDAKFSNKDDVITQDRVGAKEDGKSYNLTASGGVWKDKEEESDATRTDVKFKVQLQESSSAETDTEVRKAVVIPCMVICIGMWVEKDMIPVRYACQVMM